MTTGMPQDILDIISQLDPTDQGVLKKYINQLRGEEEDAEKDNRDTDEAMDEPSDEAPFPAVWDGAADDMEKAGDLKMAAADLKSEGKWEEALEKYTQAIQAAEPSPLLYANRAHALLKLGRPRAAERDAELALKINPDSAKALRVRGKARKQLEKWELALRDLSAAQQIDFDEETVEDLKFLTEKHLEAEKIDAQKRLDEEVKKKKRAEDIRKAQEEAKREAAEAPASGMPDMGSMGGEMPMPGGMGGMPMGGGMPGGGGMAAMMQMLMSDPELAAGLQNPKVMAAFQKLMSEPGGAAGLMSNPAKMQELMSDPEVGPILQKLMAKLGPAMGGMGGGMGMGGAAPAGGKNDDDIDLSDLPDLD